MAMVTKTIVAVEFSGCLSKEAAEKVRAHVEEELKKDQPVLIIGDGGRLVTSRVDFSKE